MSTTANSSLGINKAIVMVMFFNGNVYGNGNGNNIFYMNRPTVNLLELN